MKNKWIIVIILAILNFLAFALLAVIYCAGSGLFKGGFEGIYSWTLPIPIGALWALACGSNTCLFHLVPVFDVDSVVTSPMVSVRYPQISPARCFPV